jgi:hypothetical protein
MTPFNSKQFSHKKKRAVNPDIPRPNLFAHEKKLKETGATLQHAMDLINTQRAEIQSLKTRVAWLESVVVNLWNNKKK